MWWVADWSKEQDGVTVKEFPLGGSSQLRCKFLKQVSRGSFLYWLCTRCTILHPLRQADVKRVGFELLPGARPCVGDMILELKRGADLWRAPLNLLTLHPDFIQLALRYMRLTLQGAHDDLQEHIRREGPNALTSDRDDQYRWRTSMPAVRYAMNKILAPAVVTKQWKVRNLQFTLKGRIEPRIARIPFQTGHSQLQLRFLIRTSLVLKTIDSSPHCIPGRMDAPRSMRIIRICNHLSAGVSWQAHAADEYVKFVCYVKISLARDRKHYNKIQGAIGQSYYAECSACRTEIYHRRLDDMTLELVLYQDYGREYEAGDRLTNWVKYRELKHRDVPAYLPPPNLKEQPVRDGSKEIYQGEHPVHNVYEYLGCSEV